MMMMVNEIARHLQSILFYKLERAPACNVQKQLTICFGILLFCCGEYVDGKLSGGTLHDGPWGPTNPKANPLAIVQPSTNTRFTVLTDRLRRMEQMHATPVNKGGGIYC